MKKILKIILLFSLFFGITYSENNIEGKIDFKMPIGKYYIFKDVKILDEKINFFDSIALDNLPDFYNFYDDFFIYGNDEAFIAEEHFGGVKKEIKYAIGVMEVWGNRLNLYYLSELTCNKNGKIIINSGEYKNFPVHIFGKELFLKHFKTCYDLENFFDGNKKYKLSIENNFLDIRYIKIIIVFSIIFLFIIIIFLLKGIIKKLLKKSQ